MPFLFSRPDLYFARSGRLDATLVSRRISGAPGFMRGLRVLFASDFHVLARSTRADLDALAAKMAGAGPDLLLLGGDYSDVAGDAERLFRALGGVRPPLGAYGVLGNNDAEAWAGRLDRLAEVMARAGVTLLRNGAAAVPRQGGAMLIAGVDEHRHGAPDYAGLLPDAPSPDSYRILLSHYPVMPPIRPELMLSGHTHGGQFNLLGATPFTVGFERVRPPRIPAMAVCGLRRVEGMTLLVSKGIGASRIQARVGVRPEMDLLRFE